MPMGIAGENRTMTFREHLFENLLAAVGGVVGGIAGYYLVFWLTDQGFYGMMIPGALLGLGSGLLARHPAKARGIVCGLAGLALGLYTEWKFEPIGDKSLVFLVAHLADKAPITRLMIVFGAGFAFWLGKDGGLDRIAPRKEGPTREV